MDVRLQADALADLDQVFAADLAVFGVVQEEITQFPALLDEILAADFRDFLAEAMDA